MSIHARHQHVPVSLLPDDIRPFLAEHGLVAGSPAPIRFFQYEEMLATAERLGGQRFANWLTSAVQLTGLRCKLRFSTASALMQSYEEARHEWAEEDLKLESQKNEQEPEKQEQVAGGQAARSVLIYDRGNGVFEHVDPVTREVVGVTHAPIGPDGKPLDAFRRLSAILKAPVQVKDITIPAGANVEVMMVPGGEFHLLHPMSEAVLKTGIILGQEFDFEFQVLKAEPKQQDKPQAASRRI